MMMGNYVAMTSIGRQDHVIEFRWIFPMGLCKDPFSQMPLEDREYYKVVLHIH